MDEKQHKRAIFGWTMYDWANSVFATTIMAAVLPVYYASVAINRPDQPEMATAYWAYTTTIALLLVSLLGPILGSMADFMGGKKRFLSLFVVIGAIGTALLYFVGPGDWMLASGFFIIGSIGFSGSLVFYDSLLPHVARPEEMDKVSSRGYAMGYLGGGLLLAVNLAMIMLAPDDLTQLMTRISFLTVAVWWMVFTIPLWKFVKEPKRSLMEGEGGHENPVVAAIHRLGKTFASIRQYKELLKFILAFWLYNNGIGTIIYMASIYGTELQFGKTTIIGTLLMVQFVAIPFALLFGWMGNKLGTKKSILISLGIYACIAVGGYFMQQEIHFWMLGFAVAMVQGGSQALSRSLFGRMMPKSKSAEFYSFFAVSEKIAGTVGPLVFGLATQIFGGGRMGIISLVIFFILGGLLLTRVDEKAGIAVAVAEEARLVGEKA